MIQRPTKIKNINVGTIYFKIQHRSHLLYLKNDYYQLLLILKITNWNLWGCAWNMLTHLRAYVIPSSVMTVKNIYLGFLLFKIRHSSYLYVFKKILLSIIIYLIE